MPYRKILFQEKQPIHIVSRALIDVFRQKEDCYRFIFQLHVANLGKRGSSIKANDAIKVGQALLCGEKIPSKFITQEHSPLVSLLDFSLVMNHYHFYLLPSSENATPNFIQKLNCGFAQSFNLLHGRKDAVFGSRYKGVVVETERQSYAVSRYISIINPLDIFQPGWREEGIRNTEKAFNFLESYEFSSFPDKAGRRNAQILATKEILEQYAPFFGKNEEYQDFVKEFLEERSSISQPILLE